MDELKGVPGPKQVARSGSGRHRSGCGVGDSFRGMSRPGLSRTGRPVPKDEFMFATQLRRTQQMTSMLTPPTETEAGTCDLLPFPSAVQSMPPRSICANPFSRAKSDTHEADSTDAMPDKNSDFSDVPRVRTDEPRPDFSKPLPRKQLPAALQETLEDEEKLWNTLYEGHAPESTDSSLRYAGYAGRVRTILLSAHRYVAYTSDIGESFRPVAHPYLIKGAYGVSWAYLAGDVAHEGYKAYLRNQRVLYGDAPADGQTKLESEKRADNAQPQSVSLGAGITGSSVGQVSSAKVPAIEDYRTVMVQRAIFQGLASMGLPALTIHSIVKYSGKALKNAKNTKIRTYGPIGLGLAAVPALPFLFDEPVEKAVEWVFHKTFSAVGGEAAVHGRPETGRSALGQIESQAGSVKEKEL